MSVSTNRLDVFCTVDATRGARRLHNDYLELFPTKHEASTTCNGPQEDGLVPRAILQAVLQDKGVRRLSFELVTVSPAKNAFVKSLGPSPMVNGPSNGGFSGLHLDIYKHRPEAGQAVARTKPIGPYNSSLDQ